MAQSCNCQKFKSGKNTQHSCIDQSPCKILRVWHVLFLSNGLDKVVMVKSLSHGQKVKSRKINYFAQIYVSSFKVFLSKWTKPNCNGFKSQ